METRKLKGQIFEKKLEEGTNWNKWSFIIKTSEGKTMTLGLFMSNNDQEEVKLKKGVLVKDFKKGDYGVFTFKDVAKAGVTYHNIINIEDDEISEELKKSDDKYGIVNIEEKPQNTKDLIYLKGQCLNIAGNMIKEDTAMHPNISKAVFELAKKLYEEGKNNNFVEWQIKK